MEMDTATTTEVEEEHTVVTTPAEGIYCQPASSIVKEKTEDLKKQEDFGGNHGIVCRCGCVPSNMMSLFQMAELRKKLKEQKEMKGMKSEN